MVRHGPEGPAQSPASTPAIATCRVVVAAKAGATTRHDRIIAIGHEATIKDRRIAQPLLGPFMSLTACGTRSGRRVRILRRRRHGSVTRGEGLHLAPPDARRGRRPAIDAKGSATLDNGIAS